MKYTDIVLFRLNLYLSRRKSVHFNIPSHINCSKCFIKIVLLNEVDGYPSKKKSCANSTLSHALILGLFHILITIITKKLNENRAYQSAHLVECLDTDYASDEWDDCQRCFKHTCWWWSNWNFWTFTIFRITSLPCA